MLCSKVGDISSNDGILGLRGRIGFTMGLAKSTAISYTHEVAEFLQELLRNKFLCPGSMIELADISLPLRTVDDCRSIYVDGLIVKIQRPDHADILWHGKSCELLVLCPGSENMHSVNLFSCLQGCCHLSSI